MDYDRRIATLEIELATLQQKIQPLETKRQEIWETLRDLKEKRDESLDVNKLSIADFLRCSHNETSAMYKKSQKFFDELGFYMSGYFSETNQRALQLIAYKGREGEGERIIKAIKTVGVEMKPLKESDGYLYFGIFESSLSEGGVYHLNVSKDLKTAKIEKTVYGSDRSVLKECELEKAVQYVVDHLWYRDLISEEDD